ncbi:MAG: ATP-binding protein [Lentimicrobium sp.]
MRTQNKLLIILIITAVILFAGFMIILNIQKKQNSILINSGIEQQSAILKTAVDAKSDLVYRTLYDYTYWDDLINYMNQPDTIWANDNLYTLFSSFHVNAVWMYNLDLQAVFEETRLDSVRIKQALVYKGIFPVLYKTSFIKYYFPSAKGLLEIHGATMHSSNDESRKLPPQGYFFMAKLLDSNYISELENLTGGKITLTTHSPEPVKLQGNRITTYYPLNDWEGKTIAWFELSREYDFLTVFHRLSDITIWFLAILIFAILAIFFISFNILVKNPLSKISQALFTKRSDDRMKLKSLKSEFKKIGLLIEEYFEQQEALETEIEVRKKTEAQKEKLIAELDSANRELKDFAYIVSHDLKAPLRAIGSISQWIHADYADKLDEDGKMQLDLLLSRVHRMQNLIEGVLAYSRVTRVKEEKEQVDLNKLVKEAIEMVAPPAKFAITADQNLPAVSFGPTRLLQVFENLISNAIKYNDKENGEINIRCTDAGHAWSISIADNGPGIEEKYFEKIFQIFQTLKSRDEYESTGIGLTIVKKIVEANGGTIKVDSTAGEGTTFTFTILK